MESDFIGVEARNDFILDSPKIVKTISTRSNSSVLIFRTFKKNFSRDTAPLID
jgi:hypothetical protein